MRLRDAAKWIKEKITGKKTEETPVLTPMIATEEDIEKAKEMDREIEEMEKKSALMAPIVTSQAEMERLQRFEADSKQIAEMAGKPHEEVAEAILKAQRRHLHHWKRQHNRYTKEWSCRQRLQQRRKKSQTLRSFRDGRKRKE